MAIIWFEYRKRKVCSTFIVRSPLLKRSSDIFWSPFPKDSRDCQSYTVCCYGKNDCEFLTCRICISWISIKHFRWPTTRSTPTTHSILVWWQWWRKIGRNVRLAREICFRKYLMLLGNSSNIGFWANVISWLKIHTIIQNLLCITCLLLYVVISKEI